MKVCVRGHWVNLNFVDVLPENYGECDPPGTDNREIKILEGQNPEEEFETVVHELLHLAFWDLREGAVDETAKDITRILIQLGYSKDAT